MYQTPYAYPNPYQNFNPTTVPQYSPQQVIKVNGRNGAEAYRMPANSSALLLDESAPIVWLAQTDGAGYKTITAYDITVHQEVPPIDVKTLEERISKLEEALHNESDTTNFKRKSNVEQVRSSQTNGSNSQSYKQSSNNG